MKTRFWFDPERCSACGACAVACMDQNDYDAAGSLPPLRRIIVREQTGGTFVYTSAACLHCADPACVAVCKSGCLTTDAETGLVLSDLELCTGCRACLKACIYDVPAFGPDRKLVKCDGCVERVRHGMQPACVRVCPTGALTFHPIP
jgi:Fe-S-cluster-containing dehydrogenase component